MQHNLRHPNGLKFLFLTEMWERFSFYGISGILVLYLTKHLAVTDGDASLVSGAYMAFTFLAPILGGYVADKLVGYVNSVIIGGVLILIGNVCLALPGGIDLVYLGLAIVAIGTGFLKSTVSVLVGQLYKDTDVRRDSAYTIFYMGINIGSILAGLIISYVGEMVNWHYGFALAAIGMALGLVIFIYGYKRGYYSEQSNVINSQNLKRKILLLNGALWLIIGTILVTYTVFYLLSSPGNTKIVITFISIAMLLYIAFLAFQCKDHGERNQVLSILIFTITAVFFWSLYKQTFNSLAFFIDKDVDRVFMGHLLPTSLFVLVPNSVFIILLASLFAKVWIGLGDKNPSSPVKFLIGLLFTLLSFATFALGAYLAMTANTQSSMLWPILGIFFLTCAELCISPVGLSIVSKMAPKRLAAFLMGAWFLASSIGSYVSGLLSSLVVLPTDNSIIPINISAGAYYSLFMKCCIGMAIMIVIYLFFIPVIKRLSGNKLPITVNEDIEH